MSYEQEEFASHVNKLRLVRIQCDLLSAKYDGKIETKILLSRLRKKGLSNVEAMEYILKMENNGQIYERYPGIWARPWSSLCEEEIETETEIETEDMDIPVEEDDVPTDE